MAGLCVVVAVLVAFAPLLVTGLVDGPVPLPPATTLQIEYCAVELFALAVLVWSMRSGQAVRTVCAALTLVRQIAAATIVTGVGVCAMTLRTHPAAAMLTAAATIVVLVLTFYTYVGAVRLRWLTH